MNERQGSAMRMPRARRFRPLPVRSLLPNLLTVAGLCAGLTAILYAWQGNFQLSIVAIIIAAVIDGMDGRVARLLDATTRFGAELDSLADFLSFGVAPALLVYHWSMHTLGGIAWFAVLLFSVCSALRLARFNASLEVEDKPPWADQFFTGVPAPAAAYVVISPLMAYFAADGYEPIRDPWIAVGFVVVTALMMVSRIPAFSLKVARIRRGTVLLALLVACICLAILISYPWPALTLGGIFYLISLIISAVYYRKLAAGMPNEIAASIAEDEDEEIFPEA